MGFLDKLRMNNVFGPYPDEPLFGGLIPFGHGEFNRQQPILRGMVPTELVRKGSISNLNRKNLNRKEVTSQELSNKNLDRNNTGSRPRNVRFGDDDSLDRAKLGLERQKLMHAMAMDREQMSDADAKMLLEQQKFASDEKMGKSRLELDQRKQALDEWQKKNPEGDIKVDKDGRIVVIDKRSGKSIDTGLLSGDMSEEEKINRNIAGQIKVEGVRQENRLALEDKKNAAGRPISPTQQRAAEDDAFAELLNDPRFAEVADYINRETGAITRAEAGGGFAGFGGTSEQEAININNILDEFETRMKDNATARMSRRTETPITETTSKEERVSVVGPNGETGTIVKGDTLPKGWKVKK